MIGCFGCERLFRAGDLPETCPDCGLSTEGRCAYCGKEVITRLYCVCDRTFCSGDHYVRWSRVRQGTDNAVIGVALRDIKEGESIQISINWKGEWESDAIRFFSNAKTLDLLTGKMIECRKNEIHRDDH